jgi:hypothetical protein
MSLSIKHLAILLSLCAVAAGAKAPSASAQPAAAANTAPEAVPLSGKAVESMNSGGYTYVLLNNGSEKLWVAIPQTSVAPGQQLTLSPGYEMKNFTSKGLNRKFDKVVFSAGVINAPIKLSPAAIKMAHQGVPLAPAASATASSATLPAAAAKTEQAVQKGATAKPAQRISISLEKIEKAKGPNAYTVAQLYAKKSQLEKKAVVVRGKVVKISARILKRNWVHIQDGSGSAGKKNNDLIVTTKDLARVGDIVTVKGTLYNNMDFGSGYRYGLLVEGARLGR